MSECLYFIFGLPAFEIELKNRQLMVNHKAVYFNGEKLIIPSGNIIILDNHATLGEMMAVLARSQGDSCFFLNLGEISEISGRCLCL